VHRDDVDAELRDRPAVPGSGVGYVVQLQVEKDLDLAGENLAYEVGSMQRERGVQFEVADQILEFVNHPKDLAAVLHVQRKTELVPIHDHRTSVNGFHANTPISSMDIPRVPRSR
jgi:hypothetical protein